MASWEKATCPLAALSLHYQPTKNSFHSLFALFSLTLFLSLYLPSQLTSCALNSSQQWTSYSVRESENMSSNSGPNDIRSTELKKTKTKKQIYISDSVIQRGLRFMGFVWIYFLYRSFLNISYQSLCLCFFHTEGVKMKSRKKNWKRVKLLHSNKDCKETSGLLSQFKSDQNLKSTMPSRQSPPPMNCQLPARDLLVCHTLFSVLIWLNIVDILLVVFRSSVLSTVCHSHKSFFYLVLRSLVA